MTDAITTACPKCRQVQQVCRPTETNTVRCRACRHPFFAEPAGEYLEATQDNAGTFDAGDLENMLAVADAVRQENQSADDTLPAMPDATDTATEVRVHRVSTGSATPEPKSPSGTADGEDSDSTESSTRVQVANRRSERSPNQQRIDRFLIRKELGGGQFGIVFRADDTRLKRSVALKILRLDRRNPRQLRRFETEARSAAKLHHPNIVAVYENGITTEGTRYLVCEFVDGRDLKAIIAAGDTSVREFVAWVRDLALALAYAHSEGIIHRDIKPANILVDDVTRRPKLADFGLAKVLRPDEEPADAALETRDGILGTVAFMAPEQARGELDKLGPLSDQYSLGAVLYQCLTGIPPYSGTVYVVVAAAAGEQLPQPISNLAPETPRERPDCKN